MKLTWNSLSIVIILILCGIIFFSWECGTKCPSFPAAQTITVYVKVHDTTIQDRPVPYAVIKEGKPYPVTKIDTEIIEVPVQVDTAAILLDYYVKREYSDTGRTKFGNVIVKNEVTQNKIASQSIITNFNIPETNTVQAAALHNQVYAGLSIASDGQYLGFGPDFTLLTKQQNMYGLGADLIPGLSKPIFYRVKMAWLIHFPKIKL